MPTANDDRQFRRRMERMETLLRQVDQMPDPQLQGATREVIQAILDLHEVGLERILEQIADAAQAGPALIEQLAQDELVGSLLLLYGLHPWDLETRVRQALSKMRIYLLSHECSVELLGIEQAAVRLRLEACGQERDSTIQEVELAIKDAVYEKAPDVTDIWITVETVEPTVEDGPARIALPVLHG